MNSAIIAVGKEWTKILTVEDQNWTMQNFGPNPVLIHVTDSDDVPENSLSGLKLQSGKTLERSDNLNGNIWVRTLSDNSVIVRIN